MSSYNTLQEENDDKRDGFYARLKKKFQRKDKSVDRRPEGEDVSVLPSSSKNEVSKSSGAAKKSSATKIGVGTSKPSPRDVAEVEFRTAAINLNNAMAKSSRQYQIPEAIVLQTVDDVDDVESTCQKLEIAIDKIMDERTMISEGGRQVWKECARNWYCALFPYVKPCLSTAAVNVYRESLADIVY
jgi:hypothetical protein